MIERYDSKSDRMVEVIQDDWDLINGKLLAIHLIMLCDNKNHLERVLNFLKAVSDEA